MSRGRGPTTITVRATGYRALLLLVALAAGCFVVPRLLSPPPSPAEAEAAVRELWGRQVRGEWLPRLQQAPPDSGRRLAEAMAKEFEAVEARRVSDVRVRRSWVGPPFARRWVYFVAVTPAPGGPREYYRLSRGLASPTSAFWWRVPLF